MLVCGGWLGLRLAASGREVVLRLPTSGGEVGGRVPTCGLPHTGSKSVTDEQPRRSRAGSQGVDYLLLCMWGDPVLVWDGGGRERGVQEGRKRDPRDIRQIVPRARVSVGRVVVGDRQNVK